MSLTTCITRAGKIIDRAAEDHIRGRYDLHLKDKVPELEAARLAVRDYIDSLMTERAELTEQVVEQGGTLPDYTAPVIKEKPPEPTKEEPQSDWGKSNKLVSQDRASEIRAKLLEHSKRLKSGIDPEDFKLAAELATFHIEAGARKFAEFTTAMVRDLGEWVRPHLTALYEDARKAVPDELAADMTSPETDEPVGVSLSFKSTIQEPAAAPVEPLVPPGGGGVQTPPPPPRTPPDNPYDKAFEALGEKDKTLLTKAKRAMKRQFMPGGLLPKSAFELKIDRDNKFNELDEFDVALRLSRFDKVVKDTYGRKLTDAEQEQINDALGQAVPDPSLPEAIRSEIVQMRMVIKGLSREYQSVLSRQIDELSTAGQGEQAAAKIDLLEIITNNLDTYVHRSYRAFDDPGWPKKVPREVVDRATAYLEQRYQEEGITDDVRSQVARTMKAILEEGTAYESIEGFIKESKLGAKDLSVLKQRKQIAPEIRDLLGEYKDIKINYSKTVTKMSRLVFNQVFLDQMRETGMSEGWLFTKNNTPLDENVTEIAADSSEVYAPLNGLYATAEVHQALRDALGKENMGDIMRTVIRLNGMVKFGKTVLSPTTAMRNWYSASFFALANGHFDFKQIRKSVAGFKEYFTHLGSDKQIAYLRNLKKLGVVYDNPFPGEMIDLLKDAQVDRMLADNKAFSGAKKAIGYAQKYYQFGDDFWKIMGFENEKALLMKHYNMPESAAEIEAAERIRNTYPTYSMTGRFIQHLRRFPLAGTFVSFPAEIIRTSYHILRYLKKDMAEAPAMGYRKAVGLSIASGAVYAIQAITMALMGVDDDEEEAFRLISAPWQQNANLVAVGRDEKGQMQFLDTSFLDPYAYWKRPINATLRGQPIKDAVTQVAQEAFTPFFGRDIAFGGIWEIFNNKKASGGKVFNPEAPVLDQSIKIAEHLRKTIQPGAASNMERTFKALRGDSSSSGKPFDLKEELWAIAGWRISTLNPRTAIFYRTFEFGDQKRNASKILYDVAKNPNKVTDDELLSAYESSERARARAYSEMSKISNAARVTGLSSHDLRNVMRDSGITKRDVRHILDGTVPPWSPSDASLRNAKKKANVLFEDGVADEFTRRWRFLRKASRD